MSWWRTTHSEYFFASSSHSWKWSSGNEPRSGAFAIIINYDYKHRLAEACCHRPLLYSNPNVMYQRNTNNNRRNKDAGFPTPQTRVEERNTYQEDSELCLEHSIPLELVCLHCRNQPVCSQCLQSPLHAAHEVKSIEWMKSAIASQYNEWVLKLQHKSNRLQNLHVQYQNNKAEVNSFSKLYQEQLARQFQEIVGLLMDKLHALSSQLEGFVRQYIFEMSNSMERMRAKMKDMEKIITQYDKDSIAVVPAAELAKYSFEVRDKICELLDENDIAIYKEKSVKPEWRISQDALKEVRRSINAISIHFKEQRNQSEKKGKKDLQLNQFLHREKSENKLKSAGNPFLCTLTPKNKSKEKKLKQKKSPEMDLLKKRKKSSAKMISMPASPAKEVQSTFLITPELSRKKLFKKK